MLQTFTDWDRQRPPSQNQQNSNETSQNALTINSQRNHSVFSRISPLTLPYRDAYGRIAQLWKTEKKLLLGSVFSKEEGFFVVSGSRIVNSLNPEEKPHKLIERLENARTKRWDIAIDVNNHILTVWPHLEAAGTKSFDSVKSTDLLAEVDRRITNYAQEEPEGSLNPYHYQAAIRESMGTLAIPRPPPKDGFYDHHADVAQRFSGVEKSHELLLKRIDDGLNPRAKPEFKLTGEQVLDLNIRLKRLEEIRAKAQPWVDLSEDLKTRRLAGTLSKQEIAHWERRAYQLRIERALKRSGNTWFTHELPPGGYRNARLLGRGSHDPDPPDKKGPWIYRVLDKNGWNPLKKLPFLKQFQQTLQQTRLTNSYNSSRPGEQIPSRFGTFGKSGGVECSSTVYKGLLDSVATLSETKHFFAFPMDEVFFTHDELQRVLRELAIGIYTYGTTPFFSLHFNQYGNLFSVIHPAYKNTLVGKVISMLDYIMKGYLNGGVYTEEYIERFNTLGRMDSVKDGDLIDFFEETKKVAELPEYASIREDLLILKIMHKQLSGSNELGDFSDSKNSFRIIAKQNSVQKKDGMFVVDPDFEVLYTIKKGRKYKEYMKKYEAKHGTVPPEYILLEEKYKEIAKKIHDYMSQLPICRKYFALLSVINFFSGYFLTLKDYKKVPLLSEHPIKEEKVFDLFPHLPVVHVTNYAIPVEMREIFSSFVEKQRDTFKEYLSEIFELIFEEKQIFEKENHPKKPENFVMYVIHYIIEFLKRIFKVGSSERYLQHLRGPLKPFETKLEKALSKSVLENLEQKCTLRLKQALESDVTFSEKLKSESDRAAEELFSVMRREIRKMLDEMTWADCLVEAIEKRTTASFDPIIDEIVRRIKKRPEIRAPRGYENAIISRLGMALARFSGMFIEKPQDIQKVWYGLVTDNRLTEKVKETGNRVVGGCGVRLESQTVQQSKEASRIMDAHWDVIQNSEPEVLQTVTLEDGKNFAVFHLEIDTSPAFLHDDYAWMEDRFLVPAENKEAYYTYIEIREAVLSGDKEAFMRLIEESPESLKVVDYQKRTLLHHAMFQGDLSYTELLLEKGLSKGTPDREGYIPAHYAAMLGSIEHFEIVADTKEFLRAKASCHALPLTVAIQHERLEMVEHILKKSTAMSALPSGYNDLHCAIHTGNEELVLLFMKYFSHSSYLASARVEEGGTAIMMAVEMGMERIVKFFIDRGADLTVTRHDGIRAIDIALRMESLPMIEMLFQHCPDIKDIVNKSISTISCDVIDILMKHASFYNFLDKDQNTILHCLINSNNLQAATRLIVRTEDIAFLKKANKHGETAYDLAIKMNLFEAAANLYNQVSSFDRKRLFGLSSPLTTTLGLGGIILTKEEAEVCLKRAVFAGNDLITYHVLREQNVNMNSVEGPRGWGVMHYLALANGFYTLKAEMQEREDILCRVIEDGGKTIAYIAGEVKNFKTLIQIVQEMDKRGLSFEEQYKDRHLFYAVMETGSVQEIQDFGTILVDTGHLFEKVLDSSGTRPVHIAAKMGTVKVLELLKRYQVSLSVPDNLGNTPLFYALRAGMLSSAEMLFENTPIESISSDLLIAAASSGRKSVLEFLLGKFPDDLVREAAVEKVLLEAIETRNFSVLTAICGTQVSSRIMKKAFLFASENGYQAGVAYFLRKTTLSERDFEHDTPLYTAIKNDHKGCIWLLLQSGKYKVAHVETAFSHEAQSIKKEIEEYKKNVELGERFINILKEGNIEESVQFIEKYGLQKPLLIVHNEKMYYETPLVLLLSLAIANRGDRKKAFKENLLERSCITVLSKSEALSDRIVDSEGNTLLHLAARLGEATILQVIPKMDPYSKNHQGVSPIHYAAENTAFGLFLEQYPDIEVDEKDDAGETALFYAIRNGQKDVIEALLRKGADINHYSYGRETPLIAALYQRSFELVQLLVENHANINQTVTYALATPLDIALQTPGCEQSIQYLSSKRALVNTRSFDDKTAVHRAVGFKNWNALQLFYHHGAALEGEKSRSMQPIHTAVLIGKIEGLSLFKKLHRNMNSVFSKEKFDHITPLHTAVLSCKEHIVKWLLQNGADPTSGKENGITAFALIGLVGSRAIYDLFSSYPIAKDLEQTRELLSIAIQNDHVDLVKKVHGRYFFRNTHVIHHSTGLQLASVYGSLQCTKYFLEKGEDPKLLNRSESKNALELSARGPSIAQFKYLLEHANPDLSLVNDRGETLLHHAAEVNNMQHCFLLISRGSPLDIIDAFGFTPLHIAARAGCDPIVKLLLLFGADPHLKAFNTRTSFEMPDRWNTTTVPMMKAVLETMSSAKEGQTVLHFAVATDSIEGIQLFSKTELINHQDTHGDTPLHLAVKKGKKSYIRLLLKAGAGTDLKNALEQTPLDLAIALGADKKLIRLLRSSSSKKEEHHELVI